MNAVLSSALVALSAVFFVVDPIGVVPIFIAIILLPGFIALADLLLRFDRIDRARRG